MRRGMLSFTSSTISTVVAGFHPLSYVEFISQSEWGKLSDFINFYPDITAVVVSEEDVAAVENEIKTCSLTVVGCGLLHLISAISRKIPNGVQLIERVLSRNQININGRDDSGNAAVHYCAEQLQTSSTFETLKILASSGADIDSQDEHGFTVLMTVAGDSDLRAVKFLVEDCGANVDAISKRGSTALSESIETASYRCNIDVRVVGFLIDRSSIDTVNHRDSDTGMNVLMKSVKCLSDCSPFDKELEILWLIIEKGADLNLTDTTKGLTALMMAVELSNEHDSIEITRRLVRSGADVNIRSPGGRTATDTLLLGHQKKEKEVERKVKILLPVLQSFEKKASE